MIMLGGTLECVFVHKQARKHRATTLCVLPRANKSRVATHTRTRTRTQKAINIISDANDLLSHLCVSHRSGAPSLVGTDAIDCCQVGQDARARATLLAAK